MPGAFIGSRGRQRKPNGVSVLFFQHPSHTPSVYSVLISTPERFSNLSSRDSRWVIESRSRTKTVVSCICRDFFFTYFNAFNAGIVLIALATISIPMTNNRPEKGQPCLTPRSKEKNSDV